jgi:hypothetical protein
MHPGDDEPGNRNDKLAAAPTNLALLHQNLGGEVPSAKLLELAPRRSKLALPVPDAIMFR